MPVVARRLDGRGPTATRIGTVSCYEEVRDHQARDCVPFADALRVVDPTVGWTNRPGVIPFGDQMEHVNAQGLRGLQEFSSEKPLGVVRIAVFGDSFAFGMDVADGDGYAAVLARQVRGAEVLNFGVPGYGADQMLLRFRKEGPRFHPDVVVVGIDTLLLGRLGPFTSWYKPYFTLRGADLVLHGVPVPSLEQAAEAPPGLRLLDLLRMAKESLFHEGPDEPLGRAIFEELAREIRAAGAQPVFVLYPLPEEYETGSSASGVFDAVCAGPGVVCVDTTPAFANAARRGVPLTHVSHWNATGHRIVADALLAAPVIAHPGSAAPAPDYGPDL
jgi:hypothetical protein